MVASEQPNRPSNRLNPWSEWSAAPQSYVPGVSWNPDTYVADRDEATMRALAGDRSPDPDGYDARPIPHHSIDQETCAHKWVVDYDGIGECAVCRRTESIAVIRAMTDAANDRYVREAMQGPRDVEWKIEEPRRAKEPPMDDPHRMRKGIDTPTDVDLVGRGFSDWGTAMVQRAFLEDFGKSGTVRSACLFAQITRPTFKGWMERDAKFREAFETARDTYQDSLKDEIHRRAVRGVTRHRKTFYKGELVDDHVYSEYSDNLLMFHVKSMMPEYRDRVSPDDEKSGQIPWAAVRDLWTPEDGGTAGLGAPKSGQYMDKRTDQEVEDEESSAESGDVIEGAGLYRFRDDDDPEQDEYDAAVEELRHMDEAREAGEQETDE